MKRMMIPLLLLLAGAPAFAQPVANRLGLDGPTAAKVHATFEK
jgi:hypothetical protein